MIISPFAYGNTVSSTAFTNRENEVKRLKDNLLNGINTTIISPRRWGKSSLVEKVVSEISKEYPKEYKTVVIDLFTLGSQEEFLETYAREVIKASSGKWQEWIGYGKELFKKLIPRINLGLDPENDFSLSFDWKDLRKHSEEILNLPETIGQKKGIKWIICLDEFQNISGYNDYENFEKKLRAVWQRQKNVAYCLFGSKRHMMADIFNNPSKPFYRFGDIMLLPKIEENRWVDFITSKFAETNKIISKEDARLIAVLMKNHSWYVQQLAHYTWNSALPLATRVNIENALLELIQANTPFYQKEVESVSVTQLNLLKAIVKGETQLTSAQVMNIYQLGTPRNVSKNKVILLNADIVHEINNTYEFLDPAFELWFRKQYFNQPYFKKTESVE
ncbi:ATPase [Sporocytophaga myxococcoides]|uniref:ATPase n=1 Tax=Sporocytophaga myxococcoides TaxID=153721 RepID=A0A098LER9_9BACT|nr:ATP-binding protein [Sporocytophaga myxococcoides]GAL85420.1 ATPase [Sporocytophaga myxococcoides]